MRHIYIVSFLDETGAIERPVGVFSSYKRAQEYADQIDHLRERDGLEWVCTIDSAVLNEPQEGFTDLMGEMLDARRCGRPAD